MSLSRVIDTARGEIGNHEDPSGSNLTKYGQDYGLNGVPWCVIFLWWVFRKAGEAAAFFAGARTASCGTLLRWYKEQGLTVPVEQVQPGDIVILNFRGSNDTQHCGLVIEVVRYPSGRISHIVTVEGNTSTSDGSQDNGGMVCQKRRYPSQIVGVCRPEYKEEEMPKKTDWEGHWAENTIRKAIHKGILKGYDDGKIRPDQPITRAELVTILERLGLLE